MLLNSWEACYFDFDSERLIKIGDECAELGIELMVIDDGWFGKRDNDCCSLGDWYINEKKLPGGIKRISDHLKAKGVELGIWFEPEMISPDSDLYRAHPDWAVRTDDRPHAEGRNQMLLDLTRSDVCDYLIAAMTEVFGSGPISYVKWDMNRHFTEAYSEALPPDQQGEVFHRFVLNLYRFMAYLNENFPGTKVTEIDLDNRGYDVDLSNGMEIKFDKNFLVYKIKK